MWRTGLLLRGHASGQKRPGTKKAGTLPCSARDSNPSPFRDAEPPSPMPQNNALTASSICVYSLTREEARRGEARRGAVPGSYWAESESRTLVLDASIVLSRLRFLAQPLSLLSLDLTPHPLERQSYSNNLNNLNKLKTGPESFI